MKKRIYKSPKIEIIEISETDIIKTSTFAETDFLNINSVVHSLKTVFKDVKYGVNNVLDNIPY